MGRVTRSSSRKSELQNEQLLNKPNKTLQCDVESIESSTSDEDEKNIVPKQLSKLQETPRKKKATTNLEDIQDLSPVTPPKQRKSGDLLHNIENLNTPSSLLKNLRLTSPCKSSTKSSLRNSLFSKDGCNVEDHEQENKLKLKNKTTHRNRAINEDDDEVYVKTKDTIGVSQFQTAKKALHSNFPVNMPAREVEIEELKNFIEDHLANDSSGSLYVSGPPGTGKTAALNLILKQSNIISKVQNIYINCTAIKSATAVYARLGKELQLKHSGKSEKDHLAAVERYLKKKHKTLLIVLDEIDQLESKNHSILYTIFEWPSKPSSRLILIGIANALDLTDRTLPRLQARCDLKPKLLHFAPYTKEQIVKIFTSRLESAGVLEVFSAVALQMLAGKVAAVSGDVRRALDIGRRVVELIEQSEKDDILKPVENLTRELCDTEVNSRTKSVNLKEVVSVLSNVYGTTQNLTDESEETFPLQQKIVICSLLLMIKKAKNKDVTIGKLHEVYSKVCSKRNLSAVNQAEFFGLCSLIETRGILRISGKKEPRMHKINLEWNENEVAEALKDKQLMSTILQDESVLAKK